MSRHRGTVSGDATYADIEALPEHVVGEILNGELAVSPRPRLRHALAGSVLGAVVMGPFQLGTGGPGGWIILFEPELHFGKHVLVPDLAAWRRERLPELPDEAFLTLAPDWVCEILSPSTARHDRIRKLAIYAREGVRHAWLVDPDAQSLEVYELRDGLWSLIGAHEGEEVVRAMPFDAIELPLNVLLRIIADACAALHAAHELPRSRRVCGRVVSRHLRQLTVPRPEYWPTDRRHRPEQRPPARSLQARRLPPLRL